ncbi:MAG TPA: N-acetylmuramoyl-L-alanine amidase [Candidatus Limnocylindrales bacterium]|nr:N-acetylmuramoyl-L-alanine amidase [Candidatus Limnocylindrales bacterium]
MRFPRLPALCATGIVLLTSLQPARALAAKPQPVAPTPYVIALDPGHGGSLTNPSDPNVQWDPGVVAGPVMEKDITLDLGLRLRRLLTAEHVQVVMTRTTDRFMTIADRWAVVAGSGAQMFLSLHVNAFDGDASINGLTVFYPKDESRPLARAVEAGLAQSLATFQIQDDGVASKPELWVHTTIPTVTVEPAYLTNPREAALLQRDDFRQAIVQGIYDGILAADPRIETVRKAIDQYQALTARKTVTTQAPSPGVVGFTNWWLLLGAGGVLLLLLRGHTPKPRPASAVRSRPYRRPLRRRRTLHRRA